MRVVLLGNTVPPDRVGGLPRYVRELASALAHAGCEVVLVAKRVDAEHPRVEVAPDGVKIIRHAAPSKGNPLFAPAYPLYTTHGVLGALRAVNRESSVIHALFPVTALPVAATGISFVHTFVAPVWRELLDERQDTYVLPAPVRRPAVAALRTAERVVVRRATKTFVMSEFMRDELRELNADVAVRAELLAGGIDIRKFAPDPRVERADPGSPLLFTARRLTPRTGVDRLLAAMPEILGAHPMATLALAGTGEMAAQLRSLAGRLGVDGRVLFLGHVSEEALVEYYRRATLVVMPTVKLEGFGLTAGEALASGTPVVGTPVGAIPELLEPVDPALVTADSTSSALAETITRLLSDPVGLASIGARCRARVAPGMGWDRIADRYLEAYEEAIASSRRRAARG